MTRRHAVLLASALVLGLVVTPKVAAAQKPGGIMKVYFFDSPATMSIHEESTIAGQGRAPSRIEERVVLQHPHRGGDRIEARAAFLQRRVTQVERSREGVAVPALALGRESLSRHRTGAAMDRNRMHGRVRYDLPRYYR